MLDAMNATGLDTLKATRTLEAVGFNAAQAEALVTVFGGPIAGNAATKDDVRDLRLETKDLRSELKAEIADCRSELKAEIADCRSELKADIADCRTELKAEIADCRSELKAEIGELRDELRAESAERRMSFAALSREIAEARLEFRGDIRNLKAQMYRLLLVQATVIVGLIVGLQRFL